MRVYADSSCIVSIYVQDSNSKAADELMNSGVQVWFTPLHHAECIHAIAQQVFRRTISALNAESIYRHLDSDRAAGLWTEAQMPEACFEVCADLARRHGAKFGMRTLDTLHVACALELKAERFWTFDERQAKLAKAVGLKS